MKDIAEAPHHEVTPLVTLLTCCHSDSDQEVR